MVHYTSPNNKLSKLNLFNTYNEISNRILQLSNDSVLQDFERVIKSMDVKSKGFINSSNPSSIPIIGDLWELLEIKGFLKDEKIAHTEDLNRFIIQNLYYFVTVSILQRLINKIVYLQNNDCEKDDLTDYKNLLQEYLRKVDPRIRRYLKGSRINIIDKIYVGFDTEYVALNHKENTLLSTQLSGTGTIVIRVTNIDKGFDFTKSMLADGSMVTDFKFEKILNKIPALYTTNALIKEVIASLREYMENSINNEFISLLESLCQRNLVFKTSETTDMTEYMVPLRETVEGVPDYENYFSFHEAGATRPTLDFLVDQSIELSKETIEERYNYFTGLLNESNQVSNENLNTNMVLSVSELTPVSYISGDSNTVNPFTSDNNHPNSLTSIFNKNITNESLKGVLRGEHRRSKYIVMGCHFSIADLSLLSDFDAFKYHFDTVQNTLVTVARPYLMGKGRTLVLRDTMLLAPQGAASLDQIGSLYNLPKVDIGDYITKMDELRDFNPILFKDYALRDTIITLRHLIEMEKASYKITGLGNVPATLSSLARRFVFKFWEDKQIDLNNFVYFNNFNIADFKSIYTPQGIQTTGNIGLILPTFMGGFRGGRNESYAYGIDRENTWYDYDLVSAYTTAMSHLGIPDFNKAKNISGAKALATFIKNCEGKSTGGDLFNNDFTDSYSIFEIQFKFPSDTIHPCLPVSIDETSALYPLEGRTITTGYELYLAHLMNCKITLIKGTIIPFKGNEVRPYKDVIKYLLEQRALYPKDSLYNLLYKQLGNSIYGQTGQGFRAYKRFNSRSNSLEDIGTSLLSNPVISSHITGLVRAVLGEVIRQVNLKGGKIISCTTDGLITNMPGLLNDLDLNSKLLSIYSGLRQEISGSDAILEIKHAVKGIISWSTRGQLGIEAIHANPIIDSNKPAKPPKNISAMTGFQPRHFSMDDRINIVENAFKENALTINFAQRSLRKVPDIFKDGGHVTAKVSEKSFRLVYDNRREIIDTGVHPSTALLYSKPFLNKNIATTIKVIGKLGSDLYAPNSEYSVKSGAKDYNDIALRSFIRALLQNKLNIINPFSNYNEVIDFIDSTFDVKLKPSYIANQKRRVFIPNMVPYNTQTRSIVEKIVLKFPEFDTTKFYQN
jgi:hypothetical protein